MLAAGALALGVAPAASAKQSATAVRISADPYTGPIGQHATEVEPDSFAYKSTVVSAFQVGRRLFGGGAANIGWATSAHGGKAFQSGFLPGITKVAGGPFDSASDASVAYDARHRVWLISSAAVLDPIPFATEVVVSRSPDGIHWGEPVTVAHEPTGGLDKNWTTCDNSPSSPFFGHCYTEFHDFSRGAKIMMSTSTDGGKTWGAPQAPPAGEQGALSQIGGAGQPVVQPNGTVIVPHGGPFFSQLRSFRSTDGGASWSTTLSVSPISHHVVAGLREFVFPSAELDRAGNVYVVWADCRFRVGCSSNDLVLSKSADGINWTTPKRIPIDPVDSGADHFIPGLGVDPHTSGDHARLALTYYSYPNAACTAATCELEVGFISSADGGRSWSEPRELAGPMPIAWFPDVISVAEGRQGRMASDYISTSFMHKRALPFFAVANPPKSDGSFDVAIATVSRGIHVSGRRGP